MNNVNNIAIFAYFLLEEDYLRNHSRLERRMLRDVTNAFEIPDPTFLKDFRLDKFLVLNLIQQLEPYIPEATRTDSIPFHLKFLTSLHFFAHGSDQSCIGNSAWTNLSQSMVSRVINAVSRLITNHLSHLYIKFPQTRNDKLAIKEGFYTKWGMRGIKGAVDGTHIELIPPTITDAEHQPHLYINRKGKTTINVMLICDSDANILALNARHPGSVHDSAIWHVSAVKQRLMEAFEEGDTNSYLIGDSGYGCEPWLFTPYHNPPENSPRSRYNVAHRRTRNVVERTNGLLKSAFRCTSKFRILQYHPITAAYIIYSCGVLHNIAMKAGLLDDIEIDEDELSNEDDPEMNIIDGGDRMRGRLARDQYVEDNYA